MATTHEERLQELAERGYGADGGYDADSGCDYDRLTTEEYAACRAGAEALRLLRELGDPLTVTTPPWADRVRALLATEETQ